VTKSQVRGSRTLSRESEAGCLNPSHDSAKKIFLCL
jgi:hypothetical protein